MKPSNPAGPNVNPQTSSKGWREAAAYGQAGPPPGSISSSEELVRERSSEPTAVFCARICILARSPSESCAESGSEKRWPGALLWVGRASPLAQPEGICLPRRRCGFSLSVGQIPWRWKWQPTPVLLSGESHGQRGLVGYIPWGCQESDMTEHTIQSPQKGQTRSGFLMSHNSAI